MITMMTYPVKMADLVIKVHGGLVKRDHASMAWMSQGFDSLILHQTTKFVPVVQLDRIRVS